MLPIKTNSGFGLLAAFYFTTNEIIFGISFQSASKDFNKISNIFFVALTTTKNSSLQLSRGLCCFNDVGAQLFFNLPPKVTPLKHKQ
jgi:hypothetical protein